jgi:hypothetical protein
LAPVSVWWFGCETANSQNVPGCYTRAARCIPRPHSVRACKIYMTSQTTYRSEYGLTSPRSHSPIGMAIRDNRRDRLATRRCRCKLAAELGGDHRWWNHDRRGVHRGRHRGDPLDRPGCCRTPGRVPWWRPRSAHVPRDSRYDGGMAAVQSRILRLRHGGNLVHRPHIRSGMRSCRWLGGKYRRLAIGDRRERVVIFLR